MSTKADQLHTELLASGTGALELDGTAVALNDVVSRAQLDAGELVYTPPANANGDAYARFGFKVSDGKEESASAYTMTVDVSAVNDAATGAPTVSGTAVVGRELSASATPIADADGLDDVEWRYQWFRVDGMDETEITGATSDTYTLVAGDEGKQLKVKVRFTDDAGNAEGPLESEAYPRNATVLAPAVVVSGAEGLETTESGGTDSFEVKLATKPSSDVVVTPSSSDTGEGAVSGSLTFTQMNWASAQTLTVTGVDDDEVDGDQRYEVRFAVASSDDDYNALAVPAVPVTNLDDERLGLTLDTIAGDDTVNIAEKVAGFVISGTTGAVGDAEVTVTVGTEELGATSEADGTWSVDVPPGASYIAGSSVEVTVNAQKSGFVDAAELTRTLAIDLVAPVAPGYTAPASLKVDVAIAQVSPSGGSGIEGYRVAGLPAGLVIDAESGVISGTPSAADTDPATATVTVFDAAGNTDEVRVVFPAVAKGDQVLSGFKYTPATVTLGESAPTLTAPTGAKTEVYYSAEPAGVCTVVRATGALALAGAGECVITATAPASDDYNEATATFTVTVRAANAIRGEKPDPSDETGTPPDLPMVTIEPLHASVTEGEDALFRVRLLKARTSRVVVKLRARDTTGRVLGEGRLGSNPSQSFIFFPGRELEQIVTFKTRDDVWPEEASEIIVRIANGDPGRGGMELLVVDGKATVRVLDNDQGAVNLAPASPQRVEAIGGDAQTTLVWDPPRSEGSLPIAYYEYKRDFVRLRRAVEAGSWTRVSGGAGASNVRITGLRNDLYANERYELRVRAVNAYAPGEASYAVSSRPSARGTGRPGMPRNVTAVANDDGSVTLTWDAPVSDGGARIKYYEYIAEPDAPHDPSSAGANETCGGCTWASTRTTGTTVRVTHRNGSEPDRGERLEAGRTYGCKVAAVNDNGRSNYSNLSWAEVAGTRSENLRGEAPRISAIEAENPADGRWDAGDRLALTVRLSQTVEVDKSGGTPSLAALAGTTTVSVPYTGGSGTDALTFSLTLPTGTASADTLIVSANALSLNGGTIRGARGATADVAHNAYGFNAGTGQRSPVEPSGEPLTAWLDHAPDSHDGKDDRFKVRIRFSEGISINFADFDDGFAVTEGKISAARRVDGKKDDWELTVEASSDEAVTLTLASGRACSVTGAPCTSEGKTLSAPLTIEVPGPESKPPLTATITNADSEHFGKSSPFWVTVEFTDDLWNGYQYTYKAASTTTGAKATASKRHQGNKSIWQFRVEPKDNGPVIFRLSGGGVCTTWRSPVLCTRDGRVLSNEPSRTIQGPAGISVADAEATEGTDSHVRFTVTLSRPAIAPVSVDYATSDGSAKAGEDYESKSGTLTFSLGQREQTIPVPILDDMLDEGEETLTLALSNPVSGYIADGAATGTIVNTDPMPAAWIARFGRTVGSQAVDAIAGRLDGGGATEVSIGGRSLTGGGDPTTLGQGEADAGAKAMTAWLRGEEDEVKAPEELSGRDVVLQSHFNLGAGGEAGTARYNAWGRFATGSFEGKEDDVALSGDVTSAFLGADVEAGRWLGGVAIGLSRGDGSFELTSGATSTRREGAVESSLTAAYPYVRLRATERLSFWGMGGFGSGTITVTQADDPGVEADISMRMGALGATGAVLEAPPEGGLTLNIKSDVVHVRMESDAVTGGAGNMEGAEPEVTRLRLVLEGSRAYVLASEGTLIPAFEVGLRHDAGDAETGTGLEVGARIAYARPGIAIEGAARTLIAQQDSGYEEWGASGSMRIDPGESGRGLFVKVAPSLGATGSASERLWGLSDTRGLADGREFEAGRRLDTELGYGLRGPVGVVTAFAGLGIAQESRTLRLGTRWRLDPTTSMHVEGVRSESADDTEHRVGVTFSTRW